MVWFSDAATGAAREEAFAWGENTTIVAPEIAENWRNNAVMHVAGYKEIEFVEVAANFLVVKEDRGVNNGNFGLVFREFLDEFVVELMEIIKHDVFVFMARVEDSGRMILVFVELIILRGLGEAKNIDIFVFVDGIIKDLDVVEVINGIDEGNRRLWEPFMDIRTRIFVLRVFAIKIVIAECDESWSNLAKARKPTREAFKIGDRIDAVKRINDIAGNKDIVWLL